MIHSFIRSFGHSFMRSFVRTCVRVFVRSFIPSCVRLFVRAFVFVRSLLCSFVRLFVRSFVLSVVRSCVRSCVRTFVRSCVRAFTGLFIHSFSVYTCLRLLLFRIDIQELTSELTSKAFRNPSVWPTQTLTTKDSNALTITTRDSFVATIFNLSSSRLVKRASLTTYNQQEGCKWKLWYFEIDLTQKQILPSSLVKNVHKI